MWTMPVCERAPYKVTETGWGEFTVQIRLQFVQESGEKPLVLAHPIKLHHWGTPIEGGPALDPSQASYRVSTADTAKEGKQLDDQGIKAEAETPIASASSPKPSTPVEPPTSDAQLPDTPLVSRPLEAPQPAGQMSIASKFPVHAWQYDEVVFYDPPSSFLSILSSTAPTPLPAKNRRARDQREAHDATVGKKVKGRISSASAASAARSRQGTAEPTASDAPPVSVTPGPAQAVVVGIPGEPGSADVPLEFTQEMERAEWNRLNDARIKIVAEMDQWRYISIKCALRIALIRIGND